MKTRARHPYASRKAEVELQRRKFLLASPNLKAMFFSAKFSTRSEVKGASLSVDRVAYAASAPKGASKVSRREAGTKALVSAKYLRRNAKNKALLRAIPSCAKSEVTTTSLSKPPGAKFALSSGSISITSPIKANTTGDVALKSPKVKKRSLNARVLQPEHPTRSPRVSVQDLLGLVNPDL